MQDIYAGGLIFMIIMYVIAVFVTMGCAIFWTIEDGPRDVDAVLWSRAAVATLFGGPFVVVLWPLVVALAVVAVLFVVVRNAINGVG